MGGFSLLHWLIVLVILCAPILAIVFGILLLTGKFRTAAPLKARTSEARLKELTELKSGGQMTEHEYAQKRAEILKAL